MKSKTKVLAGLVLASITIPMAVMPATAAQPAGADVIRPWLSSCSSEASVASTPLNVALHYTDEDATPLADRNFIVSDLTVSGTPVPLSWAPGRTPEAAALEAAAITAFEALIPLYPAIEAVNAASATAATAQNAVSSAQLSINQTAGVLAGWQERLAELRAIAAPTQDDLTGIADAEATIPTLEAALLARQTALDEATAALVGAEAALATAQAELAAAEAAWIADRDARAAVRAGIATDEAIFSTTLITDAAGTAALSAEICAPVDGEISLGFARDGIDSDGPQSVNLLLAGGEVIESSTTAGTVSATAGVAGVNILLDVTDTTSVPDAGEEDGDEDTGTTDPEPVEPAKPWLEACTTPSGTTSHPMRLALHYGEQHAKEGAEFELMLAQGADPSRFIAFPLDGDRTTTTYRQGAANRADVDPISQEAAMVEVCDLEEGEELNLQLLLRQTAPAADGSFDFAEPTGMEITISSSGDAEIMPLAEEGVSVEAFARHYTEVDGIDTLWIAFGEPKSDEELVPTDGDPKPQASGDNDKVEPQKQIDTSGKPGPQLIRSGGELHIMPVLVGALLLGGLGGLVPILIQRRRESAKR